MALTKPTKKPEWATDPSALVTEPSDPKKIVGWIVEKPPLDYFNWLFKTIYQWIDYFDRRTLSSFNNVSLGANVKVINGGNWSFTKTSNLLAWSSAFNLRIPGIKDTDNQIASGSIAITDGKVAYVSLNLPVEFTGDTTNGSPTISNISYGESLVIGQAVRGSGIPNGTTIIALPTSTSATMSANASATASTVALTAVTTTALTVSAALPEDVAAGENTFVIAQRVGDTVRIGNITNIKDTETKPLTENAFLLTSDKTAGETLVATDLVYISDGAGLDSGRTSGRVYKADTGATNASKRGQAFGFVYTGGAAAASVAIVTRGKMGGFSGLTPGKVYYADAATPGAITATAPSAANQYVTAVGIALSATELLVGIGVGVVVGATIVENVAFADSPKTLTTADANKIFLCDTTLGIIIFNLATPASGFKCDFVDKKNNFHVNKVTLHRSGAESINDLAADYDLEGAGGQWQLTDDGTNRYVN